MKVRAKGNLQPPAPTRRSRRNAPLSSRLLAVTLIAFAPFLAFSVAIVILVAGEERETFGRGARERTLALMTAVDTELKRSVAALEALGTSHHLDDGNFVNFRKDAKRVLDRRTDWLNIHLAPPSGDQILNLLRPAEATLHHVIDESTFERVVRSGRPQVGNLFREPVTGRHVFPVRVPVARDGELLYVLTGLVKPEVILDLLSSQGLPQSWVGVVLDAEQTIVARTRGGELVGQPASDSLRAALTDGNDGWFGGATIEGWPVYTPYNSSSFSGWTVAMGIPRAAVDASLRRSIVALVALAVGALGLGLGLAWSFGRRRTRALRDLARQARDLALGESPQPVGDGASSGITEFEDLRSAFIRASELIRTRSEERDRVEASLREAQVRLRAADARKDRFLAFLGHELRNPLGIVVSAVHVLRESLPSKAVEVGMIERQTKHMAALLDDLLDVSSMAAGRIRLTPKLCDLGEIVRHVAEDHAPLLADAGLEMDLQVPQQPSWVMGDESRLVQALDNVLRNAIKFTDHGGTIRVHLTSADAGSEWTVVTVRDTGVGIPPDVLAHVFEPFSQAESTIERSQGGLGLGLALVKGLVELHQGRLRVSSEGPGTGTEVVIELPTAHPTSHSTAHEDRPDLADLDCLDQPPRRDD